MSDDDQKLRLLGAAARPTPGSVLAVKEAAAQFLTGSRTVLVHERDGGADCVTVETYRSETPDPDVVEAAIRDALPAAARLKLKYRVLE